MIKLKRTLQCAKCPWKVSTNPHEIPNGYCETKHANLECTIAKEGTIKPLIAMACHHSKEGKEQFCVGWLHNQLGVGNNIMLRIQMRQCENLGKLRIVGEQHENFEDTLP
jgi:hypothetical protein